MTHSSPRRAPLDPPRATLLLLLSLGALACSARPANRASAPVAAPRAAEPTPARAASAPAADEPRPQQTADSVVTLIAKPGLWPLDVEAARRVLQAFGPVVREQRAPDALSLVGGPYGTLDHYDIAYSLDEGQYWVFGSAGFFLGDRDQSRLYHALAARLTELLGKPAHAEDDGALSPVVWDLGEALLSLSPSRDRGEDGVLIAIRENERSAD